MIKLRKGQEEIVGFVVIVLLVIIALVIFLGISINKNSQNTIESKDIYQFLTSITEYTTECAISYEPAYLKLSELIQECSLGLSICISGKSPCSIAEQTISQLINASFIVSEQASFKGYEFKSLDANNKEFLLVSKGNCSGNIKSAEALLPGSTGAISISLRLCS